MPKMTKEETMVWEIFRLCDEYVWIDDFVEFEDKFGRITKQSGIDLHKIYYGKSYSEMKKTYARYNELNKKNLQKKRETIK